MSAPNTPNTDFQPLSFDEAIQYYWTGPNDPTVTEYRLTLNYSGGSYVYTIPAPQVTYLATGLTNGVTYSATLEARNITDYSIPGTYRDWQSGAPPNTPATATATLVGSNGATISWTAGAPVNAEVQWYVIDMYSTSNPLPLVSYSANGLTQSNFFISGLSTNAVYYFNVSAVNCPDYSVPKRTSTIQYLYPFTPTMLSGLSMWLDGSDPSNTGSAPANGTPITTWVDKSGQGYNGTSAGTTPTYSSTDQTLNMSLNSRFTTTYSASLSNESIFAVFKLTNASQTHIIGASATGGRTVYTYNTNNLLEAGPTSVGTGTYTANNSTSLNNILLGSVTITNNLWASWVNGGNTSYSGTIANTAGRTTNIGSSGATINYIYEVNIYNQSLTPFNRQKVEGYLAWKWGIQSNLPTSHPFKTAAPLSNSVFTPTSFSSLQLWLDASQLTGFTNGQALTTWNDLSPNGFPGTATGGPTYQTNVTNSLPTVRFNGTSQYVNFGNVLNMGVSSLNMFAVYKQNTSGSPTAVFGKTSYRGNAGRWALTRDPSTQFLFEGSSGGATAGYSDSSTSFQINSGGWDRTTITIFQNGTSAGTASLVNSANLSNSDPLVVGAYPNGSGGFPPQFYMNGDIAELLVYNRALSTPDRQTVEGYLAWKWGLQSNLPVTHPYVLNNPGVVSTTLTVATTSLLLRFDASTYSGTGNWSNTGNLGATYNATRISGTPTKNAAGNGLVFNGATSTLAYTVPNISALSTVYTLSTWVKRLPSFTGFSAIFTQDFAGGNISPIFGPANTNSQVVQVGHFTSGYYLTNSSTMTLNTWFNFTATFDGTIYRLYENGVATTTYTPGVSPGNSGLQYYIGRLWSASYFTGEVGQLLVYNRALSPAEVLQNYAATSNTFSL